MIFTVSGTQIYCMWLRFMGAKIGKDVFISPENGGFREIDFMNIGDNCVLMTPNIHAHYTDHGQLQFCSIILEDKVEINFGSTIMPLTQYKEGCRLRPHAVTVKGQICDNGIAYFGNPCKVDAALTSFEYAAILFPGQGSQYPGLMDKLSHMPHVQEMLSVANEVLGWELLERCNLNAEDIDNTINAQPIMFLAGLAHVELMKQIHPTMFSKVKAVAGFSLGEITALCYAGAISFVDALKLVKVRAEVMSKYNGGAMCNIRELSLVDVKSLCRKTGCTIANIICNHEEKELEKFNIFVCAGSSKEVSLLVSTVEEMESGKSKKLRVSGAFHSKHMIMAKRALIDTFNSINISLPTDKLIYSNVTGRPYRSVNEIRQNLKKHLVSPVLWHDTIQSMIKEEDIVAFVECGPMDVLSKTVQAIVKGQLDEECQHTFKIFSSDK